MHSLFRRISSLLIVCSSLIPLPSLAAEKMTVILDWFVNPDHAPLIVAKEKGFFAEAGLEVTLIAPADPNDPPKLVAAGQADLAVSYQPQLHIQVAEGLPLVRIGTLVATPLNALVVLADGPVRTIADLKGRKIGFSIGGFEDALLAAMLTRHGLRLTDITLVNVNFSLSPSSSPAMWTPSSAPSAISSSTRWTWWDARAARSFPRKRACRPMTN